MDVYSYIREYGRGVLFTIISATIFVTILIITLESNSIGTFNKIDQSNMHIYPNFSNRVIPTTVATTSTPKVLECPVNTTRVGNECFSFFNKIEISWNNAKEFCKEQGGDLPELNDPNLDFDDIANAFPLLKKIIKTSEFVDVWLDAKDEQHEGQWKWSSGKTLSKYDSRWAHDQPNNWGIGQHCLILTFKKGGSGFEDWECHKSIYTFCEYNLVLV